MNRYNFNTVAITGATGTLGLALIQECIENKINVIVFVRQDSVNEFKIPKNDLIKKVYCSLENMASFEANGITADVLIHLAWDHTNRRERNELKPQVDNIRYSIDSVALAEKLKCKIYIGAGSQAEYGRKNEIIEESTSADPETAYGMAKLCSSQMTRLACEKSGIRHIWPRIFSTYGPNTQDTTILNYTISRLLRKERPSLTRCGQIWDFLYVKDAAEALLLLADRGKHGEVYCVASGKAGIMREYIEIIRNLIDPTAVIGYGDILYDANTVMHLEADISKMKNEIGFEPRTDFENGIKKTIEWARDYYG